MKKIDTELAESILSALNFLLGPLAADDRSYAEECYRRLRVEEGHRLQALYSKMKTVLDEGGHPALTPEELELSADVVECADTLEQKGSEKSASTIGTIAAVGGIATVAIGLLEFLK